MKVPTKPEGPRAGLLVLAGVAVALCCAGPALLAGGALTGIGAAMANPLVEVAGVSVMVGGLAYAVRRRRRGAGCPPSAVPDQEPGGPEERRPVGGPPRSRSGRRTPR